MSKTTIQAEDLTPLRDTVFVTDLDSGMKMSAGGIILTDDNMTERGIRDRWARVYKVGPKVDDLKPGEWVLIQHGRWTNAIELDMPSGTVKVWRIDYPEAVLLATDEDPRDTKTLRLV